MAMRNWVQEALLWLGESLTPVAHEINELDWKADITGNRDRLVEHLIAFANYPNGGCLVFGIDNNGQSVELDNSHVALVSNTLANLGRDAIEPPLALDHAVIEFRGFPVLLVRVEEHGVKPVHRRGTTIEAR